MIIVIMYLVVMPLVISTLLVCWFIERDYEKNRVSQPNNEQLIYTYTPTLNERRGTKKPSVAKPVKTKTALDEYLEKHAKQFALYMSEKDSFFIPLESCEHVKNELCKWLNEKENVEYAILECDGQKEGIHVKMAGKVG